MPLPESTGFVKLVIGVLNIHCPINNSQLISQDCNYCNCKTRISYLHVMNRRHYLIWLSLIPWWRHNERHGIWTLCPAVCFGTHKKKHQGSASLAFVWGNPSLTSGFPSQRPSDAENISIRWRHQDLWMFVCQKSSSFVLILSACWIFPNNNVYMNPDIVAKPYKIFTYYVPVWYFQTIPIYGISTPKTLCSQRGSSNSFDWPLTLWRPLPLNLIVIAPMG